ncbi:MAG: hypothetical protein HC859_03785 [Bacteroidia bacterium]|nr:hypothetical protein [Bacteroidia bacterium]
MKTWHQVNNEAYVLLSANQYNELGQLITKKLHSEDAGKKFKQHIDYRYNIRGWLTGVNDPTADGKRLFSMQLNYNNPTANGGAAQYNGNISEIIWKSAAPGIQSYGYTYDRMNRLTKAQYYDLHNPLNNNRFNEQLGTATQPGYDLNGNILSLIRTGRLGEGLYGTMDQLTYTYKGNQLTRVDDAVKMHEEENGFKERTQQAGEYNYDLNGSMTEDKNKDIAAITYNHLNLPGTVTKTNGDQVNYTYDATGKNYTRP